MSEHPEEANYLTTLLQLGQTLNASLDLSEVLHLAVEQVVQFVRAERGFLVLVEEGTHRIWGRAVHNLDPVALDSLLTGRDRENRPGISRTVLEQAVREGRVVLSQNAMEDPRFAAHASVRLGQLRSVLCVPLTASGRTLGAIYLDNRIKIGVFDDRHAEMLAAFANQAAIAIENARLYQDLRRSMEERLRLQQELHENEKRRLALEQASHLKSDFIGEVSHELRNPLTSIRGMVQTLAADDRSLPDETRAEFYEIVEAECDRMLDLINDLLDSSRLEANRPLTLNPRPLDVGPILRKIASVLRFSRYWTPKHRVAVEIPESLPVIPADADRLHQILGNLLGNAVKYSPDGGVVTIAARPEGDGICIEVRDEGVGISPLQQERLFSRFERVERSDTEGIPGTGLGLYLTRQLVELHGGRIEVDSAVGKGSTFAVHLPAHRPDTV